MNLNLALATGCIGFDIGSFDLIYQLNEPLSAPLLYACHQVTKLHGVDCGSR